MQEHKNVIVEFVTGHPWLTMFILASLARGFAGVGSAPVDEVVVDTATRAAAATDGSACAVAYAAFTWHDAAFDLPGAGDEDKAQTPSFTRTFEKAAGVFAKQLDELPALQAFFADPMFDQNDAAEAAYDARIAASLDEMAESCPAEFDLFVELAS